ncbi:E3 ubiquitin-protein ligase AMFR [Paragonimus heterotremus]|uniref:E3 ubiquitin-protein ligase AMFR n=1 Tax=Paragonimus heterotremus TaxID=100268 RepID=A0A8J4SFA1_9TREM|nr:E3 ubiquitin-protein ligase AMFR [Paragonimus heterotremus]
MRSVFITSVLCLFGLLFFVRKVLHFVFFEKLTESERNVMSRMLFMFVLFRSIILSGAISVSHLASVFGWIVWFSLLGLLQSCTLVATSRCSQLTASSRISRHEWFRISATLGFLFVGNWYLLTGGLSNRFLLADVRSTDKSTVGRTERSLSSSLKNPTALGVLIAKLTGKKEPMYDTVDVVAYIVAESIQMFCLTTYLVGGLIIQAYDRWKLSIGQSWPHQSLFTYYLDLVHVVVYHVVAIAHYLHLLLWSRIFSVASLVVFLHIRGAYSILTGRIYRHLRYRQLSKYIADNFTLCTETKPESNGSSLSDATSDNNTRDGDGASEVCAICWDPLSTWRLLPCRHAFHESCLRSWLEQNPTCPTCRRELGVPSWLLSNGSRHSSGDTHTGHTAFDLLLRNLVRRTGTRSEMPLNQPAANPYPDLASQPVPPNQSGGRSLFAAAVGLNLGVSIGSAPMVAAAAQAVARDAAPGTPRMVSANSSSTEAVAQTVMGSPSSLDQTAQLRPRQSGIQQSPQADTTVHGGNNQVQRRSFHFDGSRYFPWLPSLHVELSEVIREVFSGGISNNLEPSAHPPNTTSLQTQPSSSTATTSTPTDYQGNTDDSSGVFDPEAYELIRLPLNLRAPAQAIASMFPQFPLSTIVADLASTRVPELTVENLIQRPAPCTPRREVSWASSLYPTSSEPTRLAEDLSTKRVPKESDVVSSSTADFGSMPNQPSTSFSAAASDEDHSHLTKRSQSLNDKK